MPSSPPSRNSPKAKGAAEAAALVALVALVAVVALVAGHLGLSEQNIRVIANDIGGGFGGKVPVYPGYVLAVAASVLTGKPVKWVEDRSENLQADSFARDYHITAELAAKNTRIERLERLDDETLSVAQQASVMPSSRSMSISAKGLAAPWSTSPSQTWTLQVPHRPWPQAWGM